MKQILNDIKNNSIKQFYLLYGEETYLVNQYRDKLVEAMGDKDDEMNYAAFSDSAVDAGELMSIADTLPFFADYRTIVVTNSGFFKSANDSFNDYIKDGCPETTRFIFVEKEVDKRSRLYKLVNEKGRAVEFQTMDEATLAKWVGNLLAGDGKRATNQAIMYIIQKTGTDMNNIRNEVTKLSCYLGEREELQLSDVDAIVTKHIDNHIFDMITAISLKQQNKALTLYYELLALKEPPMKILALISRQFNLLMQTKELLQRGYDKRGIASKLHVQPFVADKFVTQSGKFKMEVLRQAFEDCVVADESFKKGRITDRLSVEMLIVKYSS